MEKPPVFMGWLNQHCENDSITKSNVYIQCNSHQNSNDILQRGGKINPKVHMEVQKTLNQPK
jgi:hypothetical protein